MQVVRDVLGALHASLAVAAVEAVPLVDDASPSPLLGSPRASSVADSTIPTGVRAPTAVPRRLWKWQRDADRQWLTDGTQPRRWHVHCNLLTAARVCRQAKLTCRRS